jgi:signal transduction histidine kinase
MIDPNPITNTPYLRRDAGRKALERRIRGLERQLAQRDAELERADVERERSLVMLAHELRNPLSAMTNALQVLRLRGTTWKTDAICQRALAAAERQVHRQTALVDELLDASTVTRREIELHLERLDLATLIDEVVAAHADDLRQAGLTAEILGPSSELSIAGDRARLWQALSHLVQNAIKFSPQGCKVILRLRRDEFGRAEVRVIDRGIGIAPDLLPHIFDLFTQADQGLDRARGGLGLGLAVVKGLIELHGGTVQARSEGIPGKGTEFTLLLPLASAVGSPGDAGGARAAVRSAAGRNAA